ncbi:MAG: mannonate dehydratase [Spirochaetia bacterium]
MQMGFRWYGTGNDSATLSHIKQIPGVTSIVWSLHDMQAGPVWPIEKIQKVQQDLKPYGFNMDVVESVNVHEDIKLGLPSRDQYIENYIQTIKLLSQFGVKVICYNFMPIFDWTRTDLFHPMEDGSTALFFEAAKVNGVDPEGLIKTVLDGCGEYTMPGWEPERLAHIRQSFKAYDGFTEDRLRENFKYFLEAVCPVAEKEGITMGVHPDDPPWSIFGIPRIVNNAENVRKILAMVPSPANGLTFCTGSLGASSQNNIVAMLNEFIDRVPFIHIRNVKIFDNGDFIESSHRACDGNVPIDLVMKTLSDCDFRGYIRPDHGRHIWDEKCRPGYGLYDRGLGIMYLLGVWDILQRQKR